MKYLKFLVEKPGKDCYVAAIYTYTSFILGKITNKYFKYLILIVLISSNISRSYERE